eukprot:325960_1
MAAGVMVTTVAQVIDYGGLTADVVDIEESIKPNTQNQDNRSILKGGIALFCFFFLDIADIVTDCLLVKQFHDEKGNHDLFIVSIFSLLLPYLMSSIFTVKAVMSYHDNASRGYSSFGHAYFRLCGSICTVIAAVIFMPIFNVKEQISNIWTAFMTCNIFLGPKDAQKDEATCQRFSAYGSTFGWGCEGCCFVPGMVIAISMRLFEDIPQSIVNILYMTRNPDEITILNIISLCTTFINIAIAIIILIFKGKEIYDGIQKEIEQRLQGLRQTEDVTAAKPNAASISDTNMADAAGKNIAIKDRMTGLLVQEVVPEYVWYALQLASVGEYTSKNVMHKYLAKVNSDTGKKMDSPASAREIITFIREHNVNTSELYKSINEFKTFNDFFARGIRVDNVRPISNPDNESVVLSPADCRLMCWESIMESTKIWVKGKNFTLENFIGAKYTNIDIDTYNGGAFVIARLGPGDYHRWHWPLSGLVTKICPIDGLYYPDNPFTVNNKDFDTYTENKRAIIEIDGGTKCGKYLLFVIAATMVGSYILYSKEADMPTRDSPVALRIGDRIIRGDVAGEFRYGGSTILLLFQPNKVKFDDDIQRNVEAKLETLVSVRTRIGIIL